MTRRKPLPEKLKYEPAKMSVLEIHRAKYGVDSGDDVKTAPPVPSIIPKGLATPELLAAIAVALNVYDKVGKEDGVVQLGCNMHGKRPMKSFCQAVSSGDRMMLARRS